MYQAPKLYCTTFEHKEDSGGERFSRIFQTVRAARKWAKFLAQQHYVVRATIWNGDVGGERLETY